MTNSSQQRVNPAPTARSLRFFERCMLPGMLGAFACTMTAPAAFAQEGTAAASMLEEITVTAEFRKENLQQTALAITAVSAEALQAHGDSNIVDVGNRAPSVTLTPAPSVFGNGLTASIRGVGQYDPSFALEPGVGIYVDDVYHGTLLGSMMDLLDLDRVEVLRGPQGTLSGKNSIGGSIKLFSQVPTGEGGYVDVAYGKFNRINVKASASFAVMPDVLLVRVSGVSKRSDGYYTNYDYACAHPGSGLPTMSLTTDCKLSEEGGQNLAGVRLAVRWTPVDWVSDDLIVSYTDDKSQSSPNKLIYANNPDVSVNGVPFDSRFVTGAESYSGYATYCGTPSAAAPFCVPNRSAVQAWEVSNALSIDLANNLTLKAITGFQGSNGNNGTDVDGSPLDGQISYNDYTTQQFTQELRLSGQFGSTVDWTVGAFYFRSHNNTGGRLDINFSDLDFLSDDTAITSSKSGFAHVRWNATDKLGVSMGARYTRDSKDYTFNRLNPDGTLPACGFPGCTTNANWQLFGMSNLTGSYQGSHSDYRLGVDYQWTPDLMTYAQVSTGYKGGGTNPRPFFPTQIKSFDPETLTSYELGLKSDWLDNKARTNLAVFYSKYKDIQQNVSSCDSDSPFPGAPCLMPVNAGDADIKGVELEAQLQLTRALAIDASLSYLDFKYTRLKRPEDTLITTDMISTYTPKRKAAVGIEYGFELGSSGTLTPRADWVYQSEIYTNTAVNTEGNRVDGYGLTNLRLMWVDTEAKWSGSLALTNAFDKFYYSNKLDLAETNGYINGRPGRPREWLVSINRKF